MNVTAHGVGLAVLAGVLVGSVGAHAAESIKVDFVDHLAAGLQEIDVFVARQPGSDVYRVNPDTANAA